MRRHDLFGRILGIVVFLGGIGVLAFVFLTAFHFFNSPIGHLQTSAEPKSAIPATAQLGTSALRLLVQIALLVVMAIVGSLIAGRGVQLYFASGGSAHPREPIAPKD